MTAAIVIARGGSVRLPRKNVLPFCGIPLVAWSIIQAKCAHLVEDVYLVTDDDEIADVGREYGAEIIRHPDWGEQSGGTRAFMWGVNEIDNGDRQYAQLVTLLPTGPIRKPGDVDRHIALNRDVGARVVGMSRRRETFLYRRQHPLLCRLFMMSKTDDILEHTGYVSASQWGWYRKFHDGLVSDQDVELDKILNPDTWPETQFFFVEMEQWQLCDTDTLIEFELAELRMEHFLLQGRGRAVYDEYKGAKHE